MSQRVLEQQLVVALAGRRPDAPDTTEPRFPLSMCDTVAKRIFEFLAVSQPIAIVASAAAGADLLALNAAGDLGIRRRVVLPFARNMFCEHSVADRPGEWELLFNHIVDAVAIAGDLVTLRNAAAVDAAFRAATLAILDEADALATEAGANTDRTALVVWDRRLHGSSDMTVEFRTAAKRRGWRVEDISTLP